MLSTTQANQLVVLPTSAAASELHLPDEMLRSLLPLSFRLFARAKHANNMQTRRAFTSACTASSLSPQHRHHH